MVGAILTGGSSQRMGRDKALVEISGRTLVEISVAALTAGGADEVVLVGGDAATLGDVVPRARFVADLSPGEGPLGGLLTAFAATAAAGAGRLMVVLACDMPRIDGSTVRALLDALRAAPAAAGALAVASDRVQPLTGAWRPALAAPTLQRAFDAGERAPRLVLPDLDIVPVGGLAGEALVDVDRPEDLERYAR